MNVCETRKCFATSERGKWNLSTRSAFGIGSIAGGIPCSAREVKDADVQPRYVVVYAGELGQPRGCNLNWVSKGPFI